MNTAIVYGIPNCGSVKKALEWLGKHNVPYQFHNYKKEGIASTVLEQWCKQADWQLLVNTKGTTWRALSQNVKDGVINQAAAIALMMELNSVIKRPVIVSGKKLLIGFNEAEYQKHFNR